MPRHWETRAGVGAALLLVVAPVLTLTGTDLGFQPPRVLLVILLVFELLLAAFAIALIAFPHSWWSFGRRRSEVLHALSMTHVNLLVTPQPATNTILCHFVLDIKNHSVLAIRCHLESMDLDTTDGALTPAETSTTVQGVIAAGETWQVRSPSVYGVPNRDHVVNVGIDLAALYGPASGKYDVRWRRKINVAFLPDISKSPPAITVREPDSYESIKPMAKPPHGTSAFNTRATPPR